jgi:hypothetical protein
MGHSTVSENSSNGPTVQYCTRIQHQVYTQETVTGDSSEVPNPHYSTRTLHEDTSSSVHGPSSRGTKYQDTAAGDP